MSRRTLPLITLTLALLFNTYNAAAQSPPAAMPLGTLTTTSTPYPCSQARNSGDFISGMTCVNAQVTNCPNAATINLTFGYIAPSNPQATVVLFSGGNGTAPTEDYDDNLAFANSYAQKYQVIEFEWGEPWQDPSSNSSGGSILTAACRPATFLNYIYNNYLVQNTLCAQGASAGSAAMAYSMVWYGMANKLTAVEMLAGPVLSEIDAGCNPSTSAANLCSPKTTAAPPRGLGRSLQLMYPPMRTTSTNGLSGAAPPRMAV